jgi:hypothetical protein
MRPVRVPNRLREGFRKAGDIFAGVHQGNNVTAACH